MDGRTDDRLKPIYPPQLRCAGGIKKAQCAWNPSMTKINSAGNWLDEHLPRKSINIKVRLVTLHLTKRGESTRVLPAVFAYQYKIYSLVFWLEIENLDDKRYSRNYTTQYLGIIMEYRFSITHLDLNNSVHLKCFLSFSINCSKISDWCLFKI